MFDCSIFRPKEGHTQSQVSLWVVYLIKQLEKKIAREECRGPEWQRFLWRVTLRTYLHPCYSTFEMLPDHKPLRISDIWLSSQIQSDKDDWLSFTPLNTQLIDSTAECQKLQWTPHSSQGNWESVERVRKGERPIEGERIHCVEIAQTDITSVKKHFSHQIYLTILINRGRKLIVE